eukprot:3613106-Prymnesium_polylepis.2
MVLIPNHFLLSGIEQQDVVTKLPVQRALLRVGDEQNRVECDKEYCALDGSQDAQQPKEGLVDATQRPRRFVHTDPVLEEAGPEPEVARQTETLEVDEEVKPIKEVDAAPAGHTRGDNSDHEDTTPSGCRELDHDQDVATCGSCRIGDDVELPRLYRGLQRRMFLCGFHPQRR